MADFFWRCWYSLNYRHCMVEAYLASNRGEWLTKAQWQSAASEWQRKYLMVGRSLV